MLQRFSNGLRRRFGAEQPPLHTINFNLAWCSDGGMDADDPRAMQVLKSVDAIVEEQAWSIDRKGYLHAPSMVPTQLWAASLRFGATAQQLGKAYYPVVQALDCDGTVLQKLKENQTMIRCDLIDAQPHVV
jgi:hypothetical protein